jgi:hypothetical protein
VPGTQPFTPDEIYCVYCHAVAAGPCAICGALCCADCVELVMGLTAQRAVCRSCQQAGRSPADRRAWWWIGAVVVLVLLLALIFIAL